MFLFQLWQVTYKAPAQRLQSLKVLQQRTLHRSRMAAKTGKAADGALAICWTQVRRARKNFTRALLLRAPPCSVGVDLFAPGERIFSTWSSYPSYMMLQGCAAFWNICMAHAMRSSACLLLRSDWQVAHQQ